MSDKQQIMNEKQQDDTVNEQAVPVGNQSTLKPAWRSSGWARFLTLALGVQCLVAATLAWQAHSDAAFPVAEKLVNIDQTLVDEIIIDGDEGSITLTQQAGRWQLAGEPSVPANTAKIESLLESVSALSPGLPVATTEAARQQLEVAEDTHQRRLQLKTDGDVVADLYLGSSPGFRKAHLRKAGDKAIFAARINVFDLPLDSDDWLDKQLLAFADIDSLAIEGAEVDAGFKLAKLNDVWQVVESGESDPAQVLDTDKVDAIVSTLQNLQISGFAADASSDESADAEEMVLTIGSADQLVNLHLVQQGDTVAAKRDDMPGAYTIDMAIFETLQGFSADQLLPEPGAEAVEVDDALDAQQ